MKSFNSVPVLVVWMLAVTVGTTTTAQDPAFPSTAPSAGVTKIPSSVNGKDDAAPIDDELAAQIGPRALSRAFRYAAKKASPGVVTILAYGQGQAGRDTARSSTSDDDDQASGDAIPDYNIPDPYTQGDNDRSADTPPGDGDNAAGTDRSESQPTPDPGGADQPPRLPPDEVSPRPPMRSAEDPSAVLTGLGSGLILDPMGLILTNAHVVDQARKVVVQMPDDIEYTAVKVATDRASDVAILRIEGERAFPLVEVGDSETLEIGDWVLAIGSPFNLDATVSAGIISAKDRKLERIRRGTLIQTDAAINPGNSGGPLIDLDGKVVAISTAIASRSGGYQGIGFAIPINQAIWIARELDQHGQVRRAAMGIRMAELNAKNAKAFKLPIGLGVLAYQVIANSAADKAGIKNYDVILEFAGERTVKPQDFQEIVERKPIGSTQTVRIYRNGQELELEIQLAPIEDPTK